MNPSGRILNPKDIDSIRPRRAGWSEERPLLKTPAWHMAATRGMEANDAKRKTREPAGLQPAPVPANGKGY